MPNSHCFSPHRSKIRVPRRSTKHPPSLPLPKRPSLRLPKNSEIFSSINGASTVLRRRRSPSRMKPTVLPGNSEKKYEGMYGIFVDYLLGMHKDETTIILSESFRSLFNLKRLEEKEHAVLLEALVLTVGEPPVFLALTPAGLRGQTGQDLSPQKTVERQYVAKLVRSLTSTIHTFIEESIGVATVIVDTGDLSSLERKIAEAKSSLPASLRGMTEAVYDGLIFAVTAAIGLGAFVEGCAFNHSEKLHLVEDLKSNWRVRQSFSRLGSVVLRLEDVQRPRISSSMTPSDLMRTVDLTKPTLVICSNRNRELLKEVLREFEWEVATKSTDEQANRLQDNVIVVDMDEDEASHIADISKAGTTIWIDCRDEVSPHSPPAPSPSPASQRACSSSRASGQIGNSGSLEIKTTRTLRSATCRRESNIIQDVSAKRPKQAAVEKSEEQRTINLSEMANQHSQATLLKGRSHWPARSHQSSQPELHLVQQLLQKQCPMRTQQSPVNYAHLSPRNPKVHGQNGRGRKISEIQNVIRLKSSTAK